MPLVVLLQVVTGPGEDHNNKKKSISRVCKIFWLEISAIKNEDNVSKVPFSAFNHLNLCWFHICQTWLLQYDFGAMLHHEAGNNDCGLALLVPCGLCFVLKRVAEKGRHSPDFKVPRL